MLCCVCVPARHFFVFKLFSLYYYYNIPLSPFRAVVSINQSTISVEQQQTEKDHLRRATHNDSPGLYDDDDDDDESLFISSFALQMESQKGCSPTPKNTTRNNNKKKKNNNNKNKFYFNK